MSIWDEPLTREEYLHRLFAAKAARRRKDAERPFEEKVEIVLALQDASRALRDAPVVTTAVTTAVTTVESRGAPRRK